MPTLEDVLTPEQLAELNVTTVMPQDLDLDAQWANFRLGLPYVCWFCGEVHSPGESTDEHVCLKEIPSDETLANPYESKNIEHIFRIAIRSDSFDPEPITLKLGAEKPLVGVVLSMIFDVCHEQRAVWLEQIPNMEEDIKKKFLSFPD
jgi:hypothetical protein